MSTLPHPKDHFSPSQLDLWLKSPRDYMRKYFEGKETFVTANMKFGAEAEKLAPTLAPDTFEGITKEQVELRVTINGVPFLGFLDFASDDLSRFVECKSSVNRWTRETVNGKSQPWLYPLMIREACGKLPSKGTLLWIETYSKNGGISITGENQAIDIDYTSADSVQRMQDWLDTAIRAWREIGEAYEQYLAHKTGKNSEVFMMVAELAQAQSELEDKTAEVAEKKAAFAPLLEKGIDCSASGIGTVYKIEKTKIPSSAYPKEFADRSEAIKKKHEALMATVQEELEKINAEAECLAKETKDWEKANKSLGVTTYSVGFRRAK